MSQSRRRAPSREKGGTGTDPDAGERIAKLIARAGLCSRREAEAWIAERRVAVDGMVLTSPAVRVRPGQRVTVDGKLLPAAEPTRLFRYHKPKGVVTAARDPEGRTTIYDTLPEGLPRLMPVGRLDINSEGLLLLTNDGALKRRLELPATGWLRRYRVRAFGEVDERRLKALADGVTIEGVAYGPIQARLDRMQGGNAWLTVALREGKNREVRRVLEHIGLKVNRLIRVAYGPFQLGSLPKRAVEEVSPKVLRDQLGSLLDRPSAPPRAAASDA
ncbi:pseudouridine synthase [Benzoatithermus flavus]|uniref:Pseudouridine synthase n=1 Tax=Benzoatithermus flavus TaxID=3108223 RepID=A0ABU8XLT2_9PROT